MRLYFSAVIALLLSSPAHAGLKAVAGGGGGSSSPNVSNAIGTLPVANSGDGQVSGLVFNYSGSAAANATAINTALSASGRVTIDCPSNSTVYISSTLKVYSNTNFYVYPSCTIQATGTSANPVIENEAVANPWTTLWNGSGLQTNAPQAIIGENFLSTWVVNHAYATGTYLNNNGNIYWAATGGTSASSGSGPTGTGSGITDGTAVWNYVTTDVGTGNFYLGDDTTVAIVNWPNHGLSVGAAVFLTPQPDTNASNLWTGNQTAHARGGIADSAYFGIFPVINVNDANNFTVLLRRIPAVQFSGIPMNIKVSDQNITFDGNGLFDAQEPDNNYTNCPLHCHGMILSGVSGLKIGGMRFQNTFPYQADIAGLIHGDIGQLNTGPAGSYNDHIKVYGPAWDLHIHDIAGSNGVYPVDGDDLITLQTEENSNFSQIILAAGDILNVKAENMTADLGEEVGMYLSNQYLLIDNIDFSHISNHHYRNFVIYDLPNGGTVGSINFHDSSMRDTTSAGSAQFMIVSASGGTATINQINIYGNNGDPTNNAMATPGLFSDNCSTCTVQNLNAYNNTMHLTSSGGSGAVGLNMFAGIINTLNVYANNFINDGGFNSQPVYFNTGSVVNNFNFDKNTITGSSPSYLVTDKVGANMSLTNNYCNVCTYSLAQIYVADTVYAANNNAPNITHGIIDFYASVATSLYSGGGNNIGGTASYVSDTGTGVPSLYGYDLRCNVATAARVTGEYCYNTNTAPGSGTLTTAGPVMDQGTTTGSWFLNSNPSGQVY